MPLLQEETIDFHIIVSELLLLADWFDILDLPLLHRINLVYSLLVDSTTLQEETEQHLITLIKEFKVKFEVKCGAR